MIGDVKLGDPCATELPHRNDVEADGTNSGNSGMAKRRRQKKKQSCAADPGDAECLAALSPPCGPKCKSKAGSMTMADECLAEDVPALSTTMACSSLACDKHGFGEDLGSRSGYRSLEQPQLTDTLTRGSQAQAALDTLEVGAGTLLANDDGGNSKGGEVFETKRSRKRERRKEKEKWSNEAIEQQRVRIAKERERASWIADMKRQVGEMYGEGDVEQDPTEQTPWVSRWEFGRPSTWPPCERRQLLDEWLEGFAFIYSKEWIATVAEVEICYCLKELGKDVRLAECEDALDHVIEELSDLLMVHSYAALAAVPGADFPSSAKHCKLGVVALQQFLDGLTPEEEISIAELEQLRSIFRPFIRFCPLKLELANKLEECAERVMRFEKFDSEPVKASPFQACSIDESGWCEPWV